ncbi:MAG: hypothetical protein JWO37_1800 [Acidimicrobiales bacterium]|jgi:sugar lactone lactonase YvrE|nr:hypothetical protein [Acidimicrobiales bacterium]
MNHRPASIAATLALAAALLALPNHRARAAGTGPALSTITTYAGGLGQGPATEVTQTPGGLAANSAGDLYVVDVESDVVRRIDHATNNETVVAGTGTLGYSGDNGPAINAKLSVSAEPPSGIAVDPAGNLYIADTGNAVVRKVDTTGQITTLAGIPGSPVTSPCDSASQVCPGDGGAADQTQLGTPTALAYDASGRLFLADRNQQAIREIHQGFGGTNYITTVVVDPSLAAARGLAVDPSGDVSASWASLSECKVRRVDGAQHHIVLPTGDAADSARAVGVNQQPCDAGYAPSPGADHDDPQQARMRVPTGIAFDPSGNLYIAERDNCVIQKATFAADAIIGTAGGTYPAMSGDPDGYNASWASPDNTCGYLGDNGPATSARVGHLAGLVVVGTKLYVADQSNRRVREIDTSTGIIRTVAGNGNVRDSGDGGPAVNAELNAPAGEAVDQHTGTLLFADAGANVIRAVAPGTPPTIATIAGVNAPGSYSGGGGQAMQAHFWSPSGVALDGAGNVFVADEANCLVRKITPSHAISDVAGTTPTDPTTPQCGYGATENLVPATSAHLNNPRAVAVDAAGNLLIADTNNHIVREVNSSGTIRTIAGIAQHAGYGGDGQAAGLASLNHPRGVAYDSAGNVYIADADNCLIRKLDRASGTISTLAGTTSGAGTGNNCGYADGPAVSARFNDPEGLAFDAAGNLYVADAGTCTVRKVDAGGNVSTVAGAAGSCGYGGDGGPATSAQLARPEAVTFDAAGNLYVSDTVNHLIRKVAAATVPGPPTKVAAIGIDKGAHVSWATPDSDGGSPITGYTITAQPGGATQTVSGTVTSVDVGGLTNGTSYTFTVVATNAIGDGPGATSNAAVPGSDPIIRLWGNDRIGTAIAISRDAYPDAGKANAVVLATAFNYPDALAGGPLAAAKGGPLLLSPTAGLDGNVGAEIQRILPKGRTVYLLGGLAALGSGYEASLQSLGYSSTRYAGSDRYATATVIADQGLGNPTMDLLATGDNFPDALTGGAAATHAKAAILLTAGATMPTATKNYLAAHPPAKRYALGGPAAKADSSATPLVGADRYETSTKIANQFFNKPTTVGVAIGTNYPDALGAGPHIAGRGAPLVLSAATGLPNTTASYLVANKAAIASAYVFGGTAALPDAIAAAIQTAIT